MNPIHCDFNAHGAAILEIFNEAILNSTALYEYKPRTLEIVRAWFENKAQHGFPVLGMENSSGELMGFASYGAFRSFPAYYYTVEHSVYVDQRFRRQGVGRRLLLELIQVAEQNDFHAMVGAIDAANHPSIALHREFGFESVGLLPQVGFKFGKWLDLALYQKTLRTPSVPKET